jgi:iron complex outermembrane receptor protein
MKQLLGTMAATIISLYSIAQTSKVSVSGTIIDAATSKSLPAACIKLGTMIAIADKDGKFIFHKVAQGSYDLVATNVGYTDAKQKLEVSEITKGIIITPKSSPLFLEALEIKALRASDKAPFTKTNIGKEDLAQTNIGQDMPYMLNQTPSTVIESDAGNGVRYTQISIRGVDAQRTNVTLNGIPYNDAEYQGVVFIALPDFTSSVSSIQVQRGAGPSSNGTGSFGAGINLQTNEFIAQPYAEVNNSYGSFNTIKNTVKVGTGLFDDHFTVDARLSRIVSDGYIDRATSDLQSFAVSGAYIDKTTSVRFNIFSGKEKTYQAWYGVPEDSLATHRTYNSAGLESNGTFYPNQTDNYQQNHYQLFINHEFSKKLSFNTAFFFTTGVGYYEFYDTSVAYASFGLINNNNVGDLVNQQWLNNKFYGQILSAQYKKDKDQLIVGGGWTTYEGGHYGYVTWAQDGGFPANYLWYNNNALKTDENIYAKWEHQLTNHLMFYADMQYKQVNGFDYNIDSVVHAKWHFVNPKLGLTYTKNGWQVYGSWAVGNKEPNRVDFENDAYSYPNPERLNDFELGAGKHTNLYGFDATVFYMDYKNQLVLTGQLTAMGSSIRVNTPKSYRAGIELQGNVVIANWLNANGNLTISQNKIKQFIERIERYDVNYNPIGDSTVVHNNVDISLSPNSTAAGSINILPIKKLQISLISKYVGWQYMDNTQNKARSISDFCTEDARVIYTLKGKYEKECNIIFMVYNVFNRLYCPLGNNYTGIYNGVFSNSNYYYPMAGTNAMAALNIKL